jgi:guanylate kinase
MNLTRRGLMLVLSSPSGAGKTTLSRKLLEREKDNALVMSISVTTRKPRPGEVHGKDYFFVAPEEYQRMSAGNEFLEHAQVFEYRYGTPKQFVQDHLKRGTDVLFDIDWQGTRQLCEKARGEVVSIFILPPSVAELERRLKSRAQDSDEVVKKRMAKAMNEISHWGEYDYVLVNQDLDATLDKIDTILRAERLKRPRQLGLSEFIKKL